LIPEESASFSTLPLINAGDKNEEKPYLPFFSTDDFIAHLGFSPPLPTWLPPQWHFIEYGLWSFSQDIAFSAVYEHPNLSYLSYHYQATTQPVPRQQIRLPDIPGKMLANGLEVYFSTEEGVLTAVWQKGNARYELSGSITQKEAEKIILSVTE
ncbi:MAG: DUF4367 domain-containing protein, partial [Clostridiales bacterium]|nr:DUF4367 domain-containing protein [Clostridiales bacterium]